MKQNELFRKCELMLQNRCTPEIINELKENEVFVFGSKPDGHHKSGAAKIAVEKFGAIEGIAEGLVGQSYAIPVHRHRTEMMAKAVSRFILYAKAESEKIFYVLPIGCGNANMDVNVVAKMFADAIVLDNVFLPATFIKAIKRAVVIADNEELPIKYVDEAINVDCLRGRLMGLFAEVSKRTDQPITFEDDILKEDNVILNAFVRVINVVTKEEQRVIDVLLDEIKRMSESGMGKESDNEMIRTLQFVRGWRNETNKVFEAGGSMYDLLTFTAPDYMSKTMDAQSVYGYRGKLEKRILEKFKDNGSGKFGLRDKNANVVIAPDYDEITSSGWVGRGWILRQGDKWGAVNERGEWMFPVEYDEINTNCDGGHKLVKDGKTGFCNSEGVVSVDFIYDSLQYSSWNGFVAELDGRWGLVDYEGNVIIPFEYDSVFVTSIGNNKFITVKKDGKWGCVDDKGNISVPFEYDCISSVESIEDSKLLMLQKNGKWGYVDDEWNVVFPFEYDSLSVDHFGDGKIVKVEKDGKYGYCNARGEVVIPIMYDDISGSWNSNIEAIVEINDKYGVINSHNQIVLPIEYEQVRIDPDNIYRAKKNRLWGAIDKHGNVVFPFKYRDLGRFDENGVTWACDNSSLYGYVDRDGNVLIPFRYREARDFVGQYAEVGMGWNERGLIDKNGRVVVPLKYSCVSVGFDEIAMVEIYEMRNHSHLRGLYDLMTGSILPCEYEAILSWRRDSDGVLVCQCRRDCDSFPVVVKVNPQQTVQMSSIGRIAIARDFAVVINDSERGLELVGRNPDFRQLYRSMGSKFVKVAAGFDGYMALDDGGRIHVGPQAREFERGSEIETMQDVKDVVACEGHTVALHFDGTVTCIDEPGSWEGPDHFAGEVRSWHSIVQIACGYDFVAGLKSDGTLVSTGRYYNCPHWTDIKQFDAFNCYYGNIYTIALLKDGNVVADYTDEVSQWRNVVKVRVGNGCAVGLKSDGTAYAIGEEDFVRDVQSWRNIVDIECKFFMAVAILEDGTIVSSRFN